MASKNKFFLKTKDILDFFIALLLLIVLFPIILIILLFVWIETRENPIYRQIRALSLNSKKFNVYKIRTLKSLKVSYESPSNVLFKTHLLERVTISGRLMRLTGFDEILQLINVLKGEMSLIGPRPFTIPDLNVLKEFYPDLHKRRADLKLKPGISGYWQVFGDRMKGIQNVVEMDEYYQNNICLLLELKIALKTIMIMLTAKHSDAILINNEYKYALYKPELFQDLS